MNIPLGIGLPGIASNAHADTSTSGNPRATNVATEATLHTGGSRAANVNASQTGKAPTQTSGASTSGAPGASTYEGYPPDFRRTQYRIAPENATAGNRRLWQNFGNPTSGTRKQRIGYDGCIINGADPMLLPAIGLNSKLRATVNHLGTGIISGKINKILNGRSENLDAKELRRPLAEALEFHLPYRARDTTMAVVRHAVAINELTTMKTDILGQRMGIPIGATVCGEKTKEIYKTPDDRLFIIAYNENMGRSLLSSKSGSQACQGFEIKSSNRKISKEPVAVVEENFWPPRGARDWHQKQLAELNLPGSSNQQIQGRHISEDRYGGWSARTFYIPSAEKKSEP